MKKEIPSESFEQICFVRWFRLQYPKFRIFAIPNGAWCQNVKTAQKLKREGLSSGVPDLYIPALKLWIEMKRQKGSKTSESQKEWMEYLKSIGDGVILANGFEDAKRQVKSFISASIDPNKSPIH